MSLAELAQALNSIKQPLPAMDMTLPTAQTARAIADPYGDAKKTSEAYGMLGDHMKQYDSEFAMPDGQEGPSVREGETNDPVSRLKEQLDTMVMSGNPSLQKEAFAMMRKQNEATMAPAESWSVTDANTYRDDYTKSVVGANNRINTFDEMLELSTPDPETGEFSPSSDSALAYFYARMLEPNGILTDEDYTRSVATGNVDDKVKFYLDAMKDGVLPSRMRQDLINSAAKLRGRAIGTIGEKQDFYGNAASAKGIPSSQIYKQREYDPYTFKSLPPRPKGSTPLTDTLTTALEAVKSEPKVPPSPGVNQQYKQDGSRVDTKDFKFRMVDGKEQYQEQ